MFHGFVQSFRPPPRVLGFFCQPLRFRFFLSHSFRFLSRELCCFFQPYSLCFRRFRVPYFLSFPALLCIRVHQLSKRKRRFQIFNNEMLLHFLFVAERVFEQVPVREKPGGEVV